MATIDIVTTATIRPEILDKTYKSFVDNLFLDRSCFRLIINVDPAGDKHRTQQDVLNIAKKYFSDIIYNFPIDPCFTKSVKWLWANTQSTYVFHLEDDWTINQRIDINDMISILDKYKPFSEDKNESDKNLALLKMFCFLSFEPFIFIRQFLFYQDFTNYIFIERNKCAIKKLAELCVLKSSMMALNQMIRPTITSGQEANYKQHIDFHNKIKQITKVIKKEYENWE